jgi:hypothetical protein
MKQNIFKSFLSVFCFLSLLFILGCNNEWNEHYNADSFNLPNQKLTELIKDKSDLSIFYSMLVKTGYDKILSASQSYTIWAPVNQALINIDTSNLDIVKRIVENHIARSRITTSGIVMKTIRMINDKYIIFAKTDSEYTFGNNKIIEANLPANNGLIHIINGYVPYVYNIWEYIANTKGLDSLKSYLFSQNKYIFDPKNSIEIGVDSNGYVIYDSALILTNVVLDKIGSIDDEDSVFTAILPDNTAWIEAYERIQKYFKFPENAGGIKRQRDLSQFTIVKDLFFHNRIKLQDIKDSIVSTTGTTFYNPDYIFKGESVSLSNGLAYVTNTFPYQDTVSWFKKITVEAENSEGRKSSACNVYTRTSYGTQFKTSNNKYILVDPTSIQPSVEFSVPNILSAKYNIYCVFVPAMIVDSSNLTPTKVKFKLTYIRRSNGSTFVTYFTPQNNVTDSLGITKMFVGKFSFEYANLIDQEYNNVSVKLEVINIVTTAEEQAHTFTRTMRIDCVIFEPVLN